MSGTDIPPLLSSTPPPMCDIDCEEDVVGNVHCEFDISDVCPNHYKGAFEDIMKMTSMEFNLNHVKRVFPDPAFDNELNGDENKRYVDVTVTNGFPVPIPCSYASNLSELPTYEDDLDYQYPNSNTQYDVNDFECAVDRDTNNLVNDIVTNDTDTEKHSHIPSTSNDSENDQIENIEGNHCINKVDNELPSEIITENDGENHNNCEMYSKDKNDNSSEEDTSSNKLPLNLANNLDGSLSHFQLSHYSQLENSSEDILSNDDRNINFKYLDNSDDSFISNNWQITTTEYDDGAFSITDVALDEQHLTIPVISNAPLTNCNRQYVEDDEEFTNFEECSLPVNNCESRTHDEYISENKDDNTILDESINSHNFLAFESSEPAYFTNYSNISANEVGNNEEYTITEDEETDDTFGQFESCEYHTSPQSTINQIITLHADDIKGIDPNEEWNSSFAIPECVQNTEEKIKPIEECLKNNRIWRRLTNDEFIIKNYWNNTFSHKCLLSSLSIDFQNVLLQSNWSSDVPRFAANLGFSPLIPEKSNEVPTVDVLEDNVQMVPVEDEIKLDTVPEVEFDWDVSGLKNPLDGKAEDDARCNESALLTCDDKDNASEGEGCKSLSTIAQHVLSNLPDLSVMGKTYIIFPN